VDMNDLTGLLIGIAPVLTALTWCNLRDRRIDLANKVRAHMSATMNRVLGGESLVAIRVEPALGRRLGRVHLSAPRTYEGLIAEVSGAVLRDMPAGYKPVVHGASAPAGR
jgi:hypothetical protein